MFFLEVTTKNGKVTVARFTSKLAAAIAYNRAANAGHTVKAWKE